MWNKRSKYEVKPRDGENLGNVFKTRTETSSKNWANEIVNEFINVRL